MRFTLPKSNPKELEMIGQLAPGITLGAREGFVDQLILS